jgi:hypothetical protein
MMEEDPEHGGLLALDGHAHTLDLFPAPDASTVAQRAVLGGAFITLRSRSTVRRRSGSLIAR